MKKIIKGAICAGLALTMCAAVGCKKQKLDTENRQLLLSIGALDGNFNPFTYTSANDGEMIGMTQLPLVTIDDNGNVVCGPNEVCAAESMKTTMYTTEKVGTGSVTTNGAEAKRTEYEITIKKGIMFSDGIHELTIKDVLFNLYVYLDPAYTGSTTIYSTDIQGLKAYRTQDEDAENLDFDLDEFLSDEVTERINNIYYWSTYDIADATPQIEKDVETAEKLFKEEVESDWNSVYESWEETYKNYRFTEAWQAYLFAENLVQVQRSTNGVSLFEDLNGNSTKDDGELYYTTLDPWQQTAQGYEGHDGIIGAQDYIDEIAEATAPSKIADYQASHDGATREDAIVALQKDYCVNLVYENYTNRMNIGQVVTGWATASNLYEAILGEVRTNYYQQIKDNNQGGLAVKTISGITTYTNSNGLDVLKIVINGVDPKAQFNWGFSVAPMYYYSTNSYKGKDYIATANKVDEFGVEFGDSDFFNTVISSTEKNGVPVGAGAYKATTRTGSDNPTRETFNANTSNCYFKRNDYFETVGVSNAKIKYVNYKVYSDSKIMEALQKGEIDFGKPNATKENLSSVAQNSNYLAQATYQTGGYGYIGINPKYVPEYKVRQAIMMAIDTTLAVSEYYGENLAETIYRPMSKTSWAYPNNATEYYEYDSSATSSEIKRLVEEAGYTRTGNSVYRKTRNGDEVMANAEIGKATLTFTFTIAGESTDHPAYRMFTEAARKLNAIGFDITVTTDPNALKGLTTGGLQVWAAAWTSSVDPDMYQVYHKDSTATSVNNWNYKNILNDTVKWSYEYDIITQLSQRIEDGRSVLDQPTRAGIYSDCLDLIMKLAVELPTYQRNDLCVYNKTVIDAKTLHSKPNYNIGLFDKLWEINYV